MAAVGILMAERNGVKITLVNPPYVLHSLINFNAPFLIHGKNQSELVS